MSRILTAARLRQTTEEMANFCIVDMDLWDRHSNACLSAVNFLETSVTDDMLNAAVNKWNEWSHRGSDINQRVAMKAAIKEALSNIHQSSPID